MRRFEENEKKAEGLFSFIERSVSPYHCVAEAEKKLKACGFEELDFKEKWTLHASGKYYFKHYGSTLVAFRCGAVDDREHAPELQMAAAHTDFPCLRVKSHPDVREHGYHKLNVEIYGGAVLASWIDRPLGIAGKVAVASSDSLMPDIRFFQSEHPVLTVPGYAIHLNRDMNNGIAYDKQKDMMPLFATIEGDDAKSFDTFIAKQLGVEEGNIIEYELFAYNAEQPCCVGVDGELMSAPRLDNISSVYSILEGITSVHNGKQMKVAAFFNHEEIGSRTKEGAASAFFQMALEKIYLSCGYDREAFLSAVYNGLMVSADVSQGRHPAQPEKYDPTNDAVLNRGFAIKKAGNQTYATDCEAIAVVKGLCRRADIPFQDFYNRSNLAGGSTIGAIASTFLPMRIVDIGIPLLSMHSARECGGVTDLENFTKFMREYFSWDGVSH